MVFRYEYKDGVWFDLEKPTEEEIREVAREFSIGERIEKELLSPTPMPIVVDDGTSALLVLHFPTHDTEHDETKNQEIDFIVGEHFIVTTRYEVVAPLHHLKKLLETQNLVAQKESVTTDILIEILFAHLYASVRDHTNHVAGRFTRVERDMFDGHERRTVRLISNISREFLHMEAALANQEEPLTRFLQTLSRRGFFDDSFSERVERMLTERTQIARLVAAHRAVATELRETNTALLEARQNSIMRMLTIIIVGVELTALALSMHWFF